jgi:Ca-activated chloride channel family protein
MSIFADDRALLLLMLLPALWVIARHARRQGNALLRRFGDPALLAGLSRLPGRPRSLDLLWWFGLTALIAALARPQWGRQPRDLVRTGRDLVVALDLSRSMKVADADGMRLRTAKRLAWQIAAARPGDRIGLVIFGGAGFLQLPPTSDLATFQLFLDEASFDDIGDPATDLAAGLKVAERTLRREGTAVGSRAVILVSDGERSEGPLDAILDLYRRARLPVYTVGVGTVAGARVPEDSGSAMGPWHVDDIGRPVISRLDEGAMKRIAVESGGAYARWNDAAALDTLTRSIGTLEARALASQPAEEPTERYQWPLALALLALLTEVVLRTLRGGPKPGAGNGPSRPGRGGARRFMQTTAVSCLAVLLSCTPGTRDARRGMRLYDQGKYLEAYEAYQAVLRQQGGPAIRFNAGDALYRLKQYPEASKSWREAMIGADTGLRHAAFFNMGNAFVRSAEDANALSGYLERALDAYEEALRLDPADRDAKWNLEIALQRYGDPGQAGSAGRRGRADYGTGSKEEGYEAGRETAVGALAGGGSGGDEGESVEEMDPEQARALLEAVERQQLSTHEGKRPRSTAGAARDW